MTLKLLKNENLKLTLIDFKGQPASELIFHNNLEFVLDGLNERMSIWGLPFLDNFERKFGSEKVWDLRDFPNLDLVNTVLLNPYEFQISSLIISLEKLSIYAIKTIPKLTSTSLYLIQKDFINTFGSKFITHFSASKFAKTNKPIIIDLSEIKKENIEKVNTLIKSGKLIRLPGTIFAVEARIFGIKSKNLEKFNYIEVQINPLKEYALSEINILLTMDGLLLNFLKEKPQEIISNNVQEFLNNYLNINFDFLNNKKNKNINPNINIGCFVPILTS